MAHYQNQYSAQSGTDQYGNPIRQADEYGNANISETGQFLDPLRRTDELRDTDQYCVDHTTGRTAGPYETGPGMSHEDRAHTQSATTTAEQRGVHEKKLPRGHH